MGRSARCDLKQASRSWLRLGEPRSASVRSVCSAVWKILSDRMDSRSMMRPGRLGVERSRGVLLAGARSAGRVELLDEVVAALVKLVDGVLDRGDPCVGGVRGRGRRLLHAKGRSWRGAGRERALQRRVMERLRSACATLCQCASGEVVQGGDAGRRPACVAGSR